MLSTIQSPIPQEGAGRGRRLLNFLTLRRGGGLLQEIRYMLYIYVLFILKRLWYPIQVALKTKFCILKDIYKLKTLYT